MPPDDTLTELQAWRLKLQHAEREGNLSGADDCWRHLDDLLDQLLERETACV